MDDGSRINYAVHIQGKVNNTQHIEGSIGQCHSITKPALGLNYVGIPKGFPVELEWSLGKITV